MGECCRSCRPSTTRCNLIFVFMRIKSHLRCEDSPYLCLEGTLHIDLATDTSKDRTSIDRKRIGYDAIEVTLCARIDAAVGVVVPISGTDLVTCLLCLSSTQNSNRSSSLSSQVQRQRPRLPPKSNNFCFIISSKMHSSPPAWKMLGSWIP
jgi:hypothetical protein